MPDLLQRPRWRRSLAEVNAGEILPRFGKQVPMPYLQCPQCRLATYSAAAYSTKDTCPRCDASLDRRPSMFRGQGESGAADRHRLIRKALTDTGIFRDGGRFAAP